MDKTDFIINRRPVSISFDCPHCEYEVEIPWDEVDAPDYWGDDWGDIECPHCKNLIELGDYEFD